MGAAKTITAAATRHRAASSASSATVVAVAGVALGVAMRVALLRLAPALVQTLQARNEVATPVTSFRRLREGLHLFRNGIPPYAGGVFHQAPLLLALFHVIPEPMTPYVFIVLDVAITIMLMHIAEFKLHLQLTEIWPRSGGSTLDYKDGERPEDKKVDGDEQVKEDAKTTKDFDDASDVGHVVATSEEGLDYSKRSDPTKPIDLPVSPLAVGLSFLLSPYSISSTLGMSTIGFNSFAVVLAVFAAVRGKRYLALLSLALASYLSLYPLMLLPAMVLLLARTTSGSVFRTAFSSTIIFVAFASALLWVSHELMGNWDFIESTYGVIVFVPDLTPNIGLYWYFFIEMFDQFRSFFLIVFQIIAFIFAIPMAIRFSSHPLFLIMFSVMSMAIFKSYPAVGDTALYIPFVCMHQELFKYMRNTFFSLTSLAFATVLAPLFYNLWIYNGSGNANFFYAITLVAGLSQVLFSIDTCFAMVRREWERLNPALRRSRVEIATK